MNAIHEVLFFILFAESIYLLFLGLALILWKSFIPFFRQRSLALKEKISHLIDDFIENNKKCSFSLETDTLFSDFPILLIVMESFERRFQGSPWEEIKQAIATQYLLPQARRFSKSIFWRKRNMAARAFSLCKEENDETIILSLVDDSSFLVRAKACSAAIHSESQKGILQTLKHMIQEPGYARCYYTDILVQASEPVFLEILKIAEGTKDPQMRLACCEILSKKTIGLPLPFLHKWLVAKDPQVRLLALKILARNPHENTESFVIKALGDPDVNIQIAALSCLEYFPSSTATKKLEKYLSNPVWGVRLQAAILLKKIGKTTILKRQSKTKDVKAYEAAQYVLTFG